jgi:hypothetical protein
VYFHNRTEGGHALTLKLEGTASNRDAIGARVFVRVGGRTIRADRLNGGSYLSASDARIHVGLGAARRVEAVDVVWPSGKASHVGPLDADRGYLLREGDPTPVPLPGFLR